MKKAMFTGVPTVVYFLMISILSTLIFSKVGLIFSSPQYFVEEATTNAAQDIAKVCSGFEKEVILNPPPAGAYYVCGNYDDVTSKIAVTYLLNLRNALAFVSMGYNFKEIVDDFRTARKRIVAGHLDEVFDTTSKDLDDVVEMAETLEKKGVKGAEEIKEAAEETKRDIERARELGKKIKEGKASKEEIREYDELVRKINGELADLQVALEEFSKSAVSQIRFGGKYIEVSERLPPEVVEKLLKGIDKDIAEKRRILEDVRKEYEYLKELLKKAGYGEENLNLIKVEMASLRGQMGGETRALKYLDKYRSILVSYSTILKEAEIFGNAAEDLSTAIKFSEKVKGAKNLWVSWYGMREILKMSARTTYREKKIELKGERIITPFLSGVLLVDDVDTWGISIYNKLPVYWQILLETQGYAYYYGPNTFIFVNSTDQDFKEIAKKSIELNSKINEKIDELYETLLEDSTEAGFFNFKEELLKVKKMGAIVKFYDDGSCSFSPHYMALLLSNYLVESCSSCDCYKNSQQAEEIVDLISRAMRHERIESSDIPTIPGCEDKAEAVKRIVEDIHSYERELSFLYSKFNEEVVKPTKEKLKTYKSFIVSEGVKRPVTFSEIAVVIDCGSSERVCYVGMPIIDDNGIYMPIDTINPRDAAEFTSHLGSYYSPSTRIFTGVIPPKDGVTICTQTYLGFRSCRVVKCGKPVKCVVGSDIRTKVVYDPQNDTVQIVGNIVPWH